MTRRHGTLAGRLAIVATPFAAAPSGGAVLHAAACERDGGPDGGR